MVKPAKVRTKTSNKPIEEVAQPSRGIWQDERFQHLVSDPRFKSLPQHQRKVKIDKRFQGMFTDEKFKVKYTVDKYGRKINKSNADDLRKYYELETSSESESDDRVQAEQLKEEQAITREAVGEENVPSEGDESGENDELADDGEDVPKLVKERLLNPEIDYARGEGRLLTDSSSDDESSEDENDNPELYIDHVWGELDNDAETTEESTRRLAVCNMDWDRIRAVDIMILVSSFLPRGASVLSVKIYPSQFGKERMAEEEQHGPQELVGLGKPTNPKHGSKHANSASDSDDDLVQEQDSDAEEGDDYHMEKLRQYQLNRLRYYYAVVECDSVQTADKIYQECDGIEYESSATRVDLRFIPDGTTFDEDEPKDVCTELPDMHSFKPRQFTTTALQQAKVDLTWDETAMERKELGDKLTSGDLSAVSDKDLRKIIAYSSEEDEEGEDEDEANDDEVETKSQVAPALVNEGNEVSFKKPKLKKEDTINKYRALLAEINEQEQKAKQQKYEMEFSWQVNDDKTPAEDAKDLEAESKSQATLTPIEKVLQKRSEKNKRRKEERKKRALQAKGKDPDAVNLDSDSDSLPDGIDMNDPYFAEEFADGDFVAKKSLSKTKKQKQTREERKEAELAKEEAAKELQLLLDDDDDKTHFSLKQILKAEEETKSKKKRRKQLKKSKPTAAEPEDNFQVDLNDERFKQIYSSHLFNIDPTDSHFKKTKGMERIIHEKLKRRHGDGGSGGASEEQAVEVKRPKQQIENSLLIKSLKRKIQMGQQR